MEFEDLVYEKKKSVMRTLLAVEIRAVSEHWQSSQAMIAMLATFTRPNLPRL